MVIDEYNEFQKNVIPNKHKRARSSSSALTGPVNRAAKLSAAVAQPLVN